MASNSKNDVAVTNVTALTDPYGEAKFLYGNLAMLLGLLGLILGIISGIKKKKLGWIAAIISIISLVLGLSQATHMFS